MECTAITKDEKVRLEHLIKCNEVQIKIPIVDCMIWIIKQSRIGSFHFLISIKQILKSGFLHQMKNWFPILLYSPTSIVIEWVKCQISLRRKTRLLKLRNIEHPRNIPYFYSWMPRTVSSFTDVVWCPSVDIMELFHEIAATQNPYRRNLSRLKASGATFCALLAELFIILPLQQ